MDISILELFTNLISTMLAGTNNWGAIHPIIIHFPVVLLLIVPFFILAGITFERSSKTLYLCALILMLLGTTAIFIAVSTGEQATEALETNTSILSTLGHHDELAEKSKVIFSVLSGIFLIFYLRTNKLTQIGSRKIIISILTFFLIFYTFALLILFNTAHYGAKLVHQYGITSSLFESSE
ncbi:hypothetical protein MNBD_BACTEROID05-758 [hydrothermal vent metagenome]|uniref:DUF2231 domain-containing protein n=1 Tax=hydrothermal vent metagenome TaxID=652676 RepID=A0A3B0T1W0_9ZZZZ